jgi:hypothetical protein
MELFDKYKQAEKDLLSYFEYEGISEGIEDYRNFKWCYVNTTLLWTDEYDNEYEEDADIYPGADFSLAYISDCLGQEFLVVLDNKKEVEEW